MDWEVTAFGYVPALNKRASSLVKYSHKLRKKKGKKKKKKDTATKDWAAANLNSIRVFTTFSELYKQSQLIQ